MSRDQPCYSPRLQLTTLKSKHRITTAQELRIKYVCLKWFVPLILYSYFYRTIQLVVHLRAIITWWQQQPPPHRVTVVIVCPFFYFTVHVRLTFCCTKLRINLASYLTYCPTRHCCCGGCCDPRRGSDFAGSGHRPPGSAARWELAIALRPEVAVEGRPERSIGNHKNTAQSTCHQIDLP